MCFFTGIRLLDTAAHEIGHAIGLAHSNVWNSVMAAYYNHNIKVTKLTEDDVKGAQALYGLLIPL